MCVSSFLGGGCSGGSVVKNPLADAEDMSLIPGLGRSPGEGNGNPLQYSCLENPIERGAWWAAVHEGHKRVGHDLVTKRQQQWQLFCVNRLYFLKQFNVWRQTKRAPVYSLLPCLSHHHILYQSGAFFVTDEPMLTYYYYPKSTICIAVHVWCYTFWGFWQMYDDIIYHYSII